MTQPDHKICQQRNLMYSWNRVIRYRVYVALTNKRARKVNWTITPFKNEGFQLCEEIADIET